MNNIQSASHNNGYGCIGNNINIQNADMSKEYSDWQKEKICSLEKNNKRLTILCICSIIFSITSFFCFLYSKFDSPKEIELSLSTLIIAFIGSLATFVVVRNDFQVKEIKEEFDRKIAKLENDLEKHINSSINDLYNVVEATGMQVAGFACSSTNSSKALSYYMDALEQITKSPKYVNVMDGIIDAICMLEEDRKSYVIIPPEEKCKYSKIIIKSGHGNANRLLAFIREAIEP